VSCHLQYVFFASISVLGIMCSSASRITPARSSRSKRRSHFDTSKVYLISSFRPDWLEERARDGFIPRFFNLLGYADLVALFTVGLLIHEVNMVLFLVLVSTVPESVRLSTILIGQCKLQELVSVRKLLPIQLIYEIRCQTCKS
jgi:hypothetical protein